MVTCVVTVLSQWCYSGIIMVLHWSLINVTGVSLTKLEGAGSVSPIGRTPETVMVLKSDGYSVTEQSEGVTE
jgi:hypothetical protein